MPASRRSILMATGVGAAAADPASAAPRSNAAADNEIGTLIRRSEEANQALLRGDVDAYRALIPITDDFTLMAPFGGTPTRGADMTSERWDAMRRFFRNGVLQQEVVHAYAAADMAVLVTVERAHGEVGGLPVQDWSLRVTQVYRRHGGEWRLAHRHADPLVKGVSLAQAAALARGLPPA